MVSNACAEEKVPGRDLMTAVRLWCVARSDSGAAIPRRVEGDLAEARISAEEFRIWGNRKLTGQLREAN